LSRPPGDSGRPPDGAHSQPDFSFKRLNQDRPIYDTQTANASTPKYLLGRASSSVLGATMEGAMRNGIAAQHEFFVLQIDGRTKSGHRRFIDALRAGLQLKDQFPQHDIKVRAMQKSGGFADTAPRAVLH
jgi:hypothetical protein